MDIGVIRGNYKLIILRHAELVLQEEILFSIAL